MCDICSNRYNNRSSLYDSLNALGIKRYDKSLFVGFIFKRSKILNREDWFAAVKYHYPKEWELHGMDKYMVLL